MDLQDIRAEIDALDRQLTELLCRRMDCSLRVADYKAAHKLPVLNEERERQVLDEVRRDAAALDDQGAGYAGAAAVVFSTMMDVSRALQHRRLAAGESLRRAIADAPREWELCDFNGYLEDYLEVIDSSEDQPMKDILHALFEENHDLKICVNLQRRY